MKKTIFSLVVIIFPSLALAVGPGNSELTILIQDVELWIGRLLGLIVAVAVLVFFWGIVQYITAGADEEKRDGARNLMIYGVIGLFVMVSIWGLVKFLGSSLGVGQGDQGVTGVQVPRVIIR